MSQAITSNNVLVNGELVKAIVVFSTESGKIVDVITSDFDAKLKQHGIENVKDYGDLVILPGIVDSHVHFNESSNTGLGEERTKWEGFRTGTKAALAGGVTAVCDMPLNSVPPTVDVEALEVKKAACQRAMNDGEFWCDMAFWGGVTRNNYDSEELINLVKAGVRGFKCFMIESGVEEFPAVNKEQIETTMKLLEPHPTMFMFHAEQAPNEAEALKNGNETASESEQHKHSCLPQSYSTFLMSRPDSYEVDAIRTVIECSKVAPNLPLHIVHLASAEALPYIRKAREDGVKLSIETCFHYLTFAAEEIEDKSTVHKCCPPIRGDANRAQIWNALFDGDVQTVVSDHSPCTANLKDLDTGDFMTAWGGISSVGMGLPVLWTQAQKYYPQVTLADVSRWMSKDTSKQLGLDHKKGEIKVGLDADFCVFDPNAVWVLDQDKMHWKNKLSPYSGREFRGQVQETILRGRSAYSVKEGFTKGQGEMILEPRTFPSEQGKVQA